MSKTLTTYEALKANETKRVRPVGDGSWWGVRKLIDALNIGNIDVTQPKLWEAEEPIWEGFVLIPKDSKTFGYQTVEEAEWVRSHQANPDEWEVVHVREVRP